MDGFIVVDKPAGISSHGVVSRVRRLTGQRGVGHTGTLDPFATGVLPIALGEATKAIRFLDESVKEYVATLCLGVTTDTYDVTGTELLHRSLPPLDDAKISAALAHFLGTIQQVPPMYSALKLEGQPLYRLARKGISVERQPRTVTVHELTLQRCQLPWLDIFVSCSPGTYVRSLAHDLGELLGCGAHLTALRRMRSGIFVIADALTLEGLDSLSQQGPLPLVTIAEALDHLPFITLGEESARRVRNGVRPVVTSDDAAALGPVPPGASLVLMGPAGPVAVAQVPVAGFTAGETLGLLRVFS